MRTEARKMVRERERKIIEGRRKCLYVNKGFSINFSSSERIRKKELAKDFERDFLHLCY